ncbi:MAG: ABC transporter ATP-binding protein, partial [Hyphomicrobiales bacterium]
MSETVKDVIIGIRGVTVRFGEQTVLNKLDLDIYRGEILGIVGASGAGKSVLMRSIIGLNRMQAGQIRIFDEDYTNLPDEQRKAIDRRWGVLFQHGALFSSLTVQQNIEMPMREYLRLSPRLLDEMARMKIAMVGLKPEAAYK